MGKQQKGGYYVAKGKYERWLEPDGLLLLEAWARDGLTDEQIASKMGINPCTLYEWQKRYPEISKSLKRGKEVVDTMVENALLKRALGYRYDEVTQERTKNPETGEELLVTTKVVTKEVQPDTTAQIFWLKNRKPKTWRDKPEHTEGAAFEKLDNLLSEFRQIVNTETS